ncbi:MAG: hydroxymethylbilane synthase, partial [Chitinophagales bacterium]
IKSEGDIDLQTPLYEIGVQGIFTRALDLALLNNEIDLAVHSMKDVPVQPAIGTSQAAVLKRASWKDLLVYKGEWEVISKGLGLTNGQLPGMNPNSLLQFTVATSSIRRKAQWLNRYPHHKVENLRGNVNTRLAKLERNDWNAAIFAAAGLERIGLRPPNSMELDWMLPAPAQGAIIVICRENDESCLEACQFLNDMDTMHCTRIERDFLRTLLGGCSTPISAFAEVKNEQVHFRGNIMSVDGKERMDIEKICGVGNSEWVGKDSAQELLENGARKIMNSFQNAR